MVVRKSAGARPAPGKAGKPGKARKAVSEPPRPGGARELTKQETREALLRAGMELFAEQGLDVPSLDALCARAGFTRGAFYVHFADREEFIVAVMERIVTQTIPAAVIDNPLVEPESAPQIAAEPVAPPPPAAPVPTVEEKPAKAAAAG